jgi:hypothetical protein
MIFSILVIASLIISLTATPIRHSLSNTLLLPKLEKRGGSVSSRSSSCSSLDFASPPAAPVLKTANTEEDRNSGEKRKRVISDERRLRNNKAKREIGDEQRLRNNKAKRDSRARKNRELELDPIALKAWRLKIKDVSARKREKRKILFDANAAAKNEWRLKEKKRNAENRLKKKMEEIKANPDQKEKELYMKKAGAEIYSRAKTKRLAAFADDPAKETAWKLKKSEANARCRLKQKIKAQNVADIVGGQKSNNLDDENDNEEDENEEEGKFEEDEDENAIGEVGIVEGDDTESIETIESVYRNGN